jgi:hypothetical protein
MSGFFNSSPQALRQVLRDKLEAHVHLLLVENFEPSVCHPTDIPACDMALSRGHKIRV